MGYHNARSETMLVSAMNRLTRKVDALNLWHRCEKRGSRNHLEGDLMAVAMMRKIL
jgi:hypothetical protein